MSLNKILINFNVLSIAAKVRRTESIFDSVPNPHENLYRNEQFSLSVHQINRDGTIFRLSIVANSPGNRENKKGAIAPLPQIMNQLFDQKPFGQPLVYPQYSDTYPPTHGSPHPTLLQLAQVVLAEYQALPKHA